MMHDLNLGRRFEFIDLSPPQEDFAAAVLEGLGRQSKSIPCRFLYDARGSALFDRICALPEYYLTRTEAEILRTHAAELAAAIGPGACLVELGSGSSVKTRLVLDALDAPAAYVPIDISRDHLRDAARGVAEAYPHLCVIAICADYAAPMLLPEAGRRRVAFFPGSTIGNLMHEEAIALLSAWRERLGPRGLLLLGADLRKDAATLEAAYDDEAGVTEAFIKNALVRINRELDGDIDLDDFAYEARYKPAPGRVEMHLCSRRAQTLRIAGRELKLAAGERIHIENSHKYSLDELQALARAAGFRVRSVHCDAGRRFSAMLWSAGQIGADD